MRFKFEAGPSAIAAVNSLQKQLASLRDAEGLTRDDVAARLDMSPRTMRNWEKCYDSPSLPHFIEWAGSYDRRLAIIDRLSDAEVSPKVPAIGGSLVDRELRHIGAVIKQRRRAVPLSAADFATTLGLTRSTIVKIESGRPAQLVTLLTITEKLGCRIRLVPWQDERRAND